MKVIKKGRPQKGWAKEYDCTGSGNGGGGCGAVLLVESCDIYRTTSSHYDGSSEKYDTFMCMECGVETDVPDVPSKVVRRTKADVLKEAEVRARGSLL